MGIDWLRAAWRRTRGGVSATALATALGCMPELEPELGEFVARGEHVEVWASEGLEVCGGNVEHMDRFVERFREVVGPRPEAEAVHRYYVLDEEDWGEWVEVGGCQRGAHGCTRLNRTIYASKLPSAHELVHAEISADGHSLFEEGLAEVFGDGPPDAWPLGYDILDGLAIGDSGLPFAGYERAAHFSRFLIDRHGIDGLLRLRDATVEGDSIERLESAFEAALGTSLWSALDAYDDYPVFCLNAGYRFALLECETPTTPWLSRLSFAETADLTCADDDVLGPFEGEIFVLRAFEVDRFDKYDIEVRAEGADEARAWIVKCGTRCRGGLGDDPEHPFEPPQIAIEVRSGEPREELLYPGKYWIRLSRPMDSPGKVSLRVEGRGEKRARR